ncbi:MAG: DNA polymerase III subunit delta [Gemmatimonadota bacterium]|nr:MAG: DNA polymerase III subunit delta [Gemmatimonadota bacterium]
MAAQLSFDTAYRSLKRDTAAPVYYITGVEDLLKDELVDLVLDQTVDSSLRDFNVDIRSASEVNGEEFHSLVETPPMLAERRAVVIKNVELWRKNSKVWQVVYRYLESPSPTTVLVLLAGADQKQDKKLAQAAVHVVIERLNPDRLRRWVGVRAERAGFSLTATAREHLLNSVGADLSPLAMEVDKLAAVATPDQPVDVELVAQMVGIRRGETLHDWVDAVLLRDTPKAVATLEPVLAAAGVTGVRMLSALGTGLVGVRLGVALLQDGVPLSRVESDLLNAIRSSRLFGLRGWKHDAAVWTGAAQRWTTPEIARALSLAYECDRALKSTTLSDEKGTLTGLLLNLSPIEEAAA